MREVSIEVINETESNAATMTIQNKGTWQRQKTMFIHTNCEEAIQLPMDHNGAPQLHMSHSAHSILNEVEEARVETDYKMFKIKKYSTKCWVHKKKG